MRWIISASRRTDIPGFYGEWFMRRIQAGFAGVVAPYGGTVTQSYFLLDSDGAAPSNDLGSGLTDEQMRQKSSFIGWDFERTWRVAEGKDYPRLWWEARN